MLASLRKHLFDTYWRVSADQVNWVNQAAFYLFTLLVGLNLWNLSNQCKNLGAQTVRAINGLALAAGALFILLSFHEGDKNYLHPLMYGVLSLKNLWAYLSLNLLFRPPFLSAWLLAYVAVYCFLVRTGRERSILRFTAVCATAYMGLCLRDLVPYKGELLVVDALGIACLLAWRRDGSRLHPLWVGLPVVVGGVIYLALRGLEARLSAPNPVCILLVAGSLVLFAGGTALAWRRGFLAGWSWLVTFALVAFLLLLNTNYPGSLNYQKILRVMLTTPRYFLDELALATVLLVAAACYRRWRPKGSLLWLDSLNVMLITLALADLRLAQVLEARFDWDMLSLALGESPTMMWRMAQPYLPTVTGALTAIIVVYSAALAGLKRLASRTQGQLAPARFNLEYALAAMVLLGLVGRWTLGRDKVQGQTLMVLAKSSPLWRRSVSPPMDENLFRAAASRLGMQQLVASPPMPDGTRTVRDLNVVFILLESSYNKYLSLFSGKEETQPLLSQYQERMELFPNFYSSFAGSINAQFANFTGLYPVRDYKAFTQQRVAVKSIFEILHDHGYATSLFTSTHLDYTGFRDFLRGRNVDEMFDAANMPGARLNNSVSWGLHEEETLGAMQRQIRKHVAAKQKFFLTYIPVAPHNPFDGTPERFKKYRAKKIYDYTPHYLNELLYMDWIITSLADELKSAGVLDKTLIVITGDHGEMLGVDGGPIGHGWALTPELANVPLIIMDPGKPGRRVNETVGSHVDLLPTILDKLGIPAPPQQLYQGASLYSSDALTDRVIYLNTFRQYAVLQGRRLVCGDREVNADAHPMAFAMENDGARTTFAEIPTLTHLPPAISDFDAFQENFLRNYSYYTQTVRCGTPLQLTARQ